MKSLKAYAVAIALTLVIGFSALAGETQTPPCAPQPGETETPPCSNAPMTSDATGQTETPPADGAEATTLAMDLVQSMLSIF